MKKFFFLGILLLLVTGCDPYGYAEDDSFHHIKKENVLCKKISTEESVLRGGVIRYRDEYKCVFIKVSITETTHANADLKLKLKKLISNDETSN